jgi:hypothetical protein
MSVAGDIVRIGFTPELHTYGQVLVDPYVAVYDCPTADEIGDMASVAGRPILFTVAVAHRALSRDWQTVGKAPQDSALPAVPLFFMQDRFNPQSCKIIDAQGTMRPVTPQECAGLEAAAVWDAEHVAQRLRDHYAGRPNAHLESMKLRL